MNTRDNPDDKRIIYLLTAGVYLLVTMLSFRVSPSLGFGLIFAGVLIGLTAGIFFGRRKLLDIRAEGRDKHTFAGRIKTRLADCRAKEARFRNESDFIRNRIQSLREDLERSTKADEAERARAQVLIKEFEAEFDLRHAKVSFFSECVTRLEELLARHQLHQSIIARHKELEELRSSNFDDEAGMEETRYHLEQDTIELDTISELSEDVSVSFKAERARELRARLEELRKSLGGKTAEQAE